MSAYRRSARRSERASSVVRVPGWSCPRSRRVADHDRRFRTNRRLDPAERVSASFESSRTYLLSGTRNSAGACHFEYPALTASDARPIIRARDIAIDSIGCNRLVEEGIPTKSDDGRPGLERVEEAILGRSSNTDSAQVASNATAYHKVWWRDLAFLTVNSD